MTFFFGTDGVLIYLIIESTVEEVNTVKSTIFHLHVKTLNVLVYANHKNRCCTQLINE